MNRRVVRYLRYAIHGETQRPRAPRRPARRGPARNWKYRAWIRSLPSAVSGLPGCEAAHTGTDGGMRQKASDYSCVPLTPEEHIEYHRVGKREFERATGLDCGHLVQRLNRDWFRLRNYVK
ncbi:MAG: hypothetical protein ACLPX8_05230 [Bryobacteraceae bacterium]|jgi:hypothetical protein